MAVGPGWDSYSFLANAAEFAGRGYGYTEPARPPLISVFAALPLAFGLFDERVIQVVDALLTLASLGGFYLLVRRRFERPVAALATIALLASPPVWEWIGVGYTDFAAMGICAWALYFAVRATEDDPRFYTLAFPLLVAAALMRITSLMFVLPLFVWLALRARPFRQARWLAAGVAAAFAFYAPFAAYYMRVVGDALYPFVASLQVQAAGSSADAYRELGSFLTSAPWLAAPETACGGHDRRARARRTRPRAGRLPSAARQPGTVRARPAGRARRRGRDVGREERRLRRVAGRGLRRGVRGMAPPGVACRDLAHRHRPSGPRGARPRRGDGRVAARVLLVPRGVGAASDALLPHDGAGRDLPRGARVAPAAPRGGGDLARSTHATLARRRARSGTGRGRARDRTRAQRRDDLVAARSLGCRRQGDRRVAGEAAGGLSAGGVLGPVAGDQLVPAQPGPRDAVLRGRARGVARARSQRRRVLRDREARVRARVREPLRHRFGPRARTRLRTRAAARDAVPGRRLGELPRAAHGLLDPPRARRG